MITDKYDLERFLKAQDKDYKQALEEVKNGKKKTCWIWYIFPIIDGINDSRMTNFYSIKSLNEAHEYIRNDKLRNRLIEITNVLYKLDTKDSSEIFGAQDNFKVHACMTLFSIAAPEETIFKKVLNKYFNGEPEKLTVQKLNIKKSN